MEYNECLICFEEDIVLVDICNKHKVCVKCYKELFKRKYNCCPYCLKEIKYKNIQDENKNYYIICKIFCFRN